MRLLGRRLPLALAATVLGGCDFSASTTIIGDTSPYDTSDNPDADTDADTEADADADSDSDTDTDSPPDTGDLLPADIDDDGDGYTENQGDCDDTDRTTHPETLDGCDGIDNDCDGAIDDDAPGDAYEPNDGTPYNLGSLEVDPEVSLAAWLTNDDDVDRFQFTIVDDTWDFFTLHIDISDIPADANYLVSFNRLRSDGDAPVGEIDSTFASGTAAFEYGDTSGYEDGGDYEVVIESLGGASCAHSYLLAVSQ